jgi:aspartate/methionine/tyrosine aminotransferase
VIASDECYSEIYFDEAAPPLGGLEAAHRLGRGFERLVMLSSLSKRSNVPGMRSGFVAGDAALLKKFLLYRTYHGAALSPVWQPPASPRGTTRRTCATTARCICRSSRPSRRCSPTCST